MIGVVIKKGAKVQIYRILYVLLISQSDVNA